MGAGHDHGAGHAHGGATGTQNRKRLVIVLALAATYMVAEIIGGLLTNSLALLADAGHMLSDVASLALSLFAIWIARRPATPQHTFGYYRTEILAALINGATLVAISIYIFYEAFHRFGEPPEVQGALMMAIAVGGLLINLTGLWILNASKEESLNIRGAWLHVMADALGSVGAIAAGALIWFLDWNWADPAASVLIGILVLVASWNLLKETVLILMEGAPGHVDIDEVRNAIRSVPGVLGVHHLHVWTITSGMISLSAHVVVEAGRFGRQVLEEVNRPLHDRFGIAHTTIQLEPEGLAEPEVAF